MSDKNSVKGTNETAFQTALSEKISKEYAVFIGTIQAGSANLAIECAYEIVWKDNITQYVENERLDLSDREYTVLLGCSDVLQYAYNIWETTHELTQYEDIELCLKIAAAHIQADIDAAVVLDQAALAETLVELRETRKKIEAREQEVQKQLIKSLGSRKRLKVAGYVLSYLTKQRANINNTKLREKYPEVYKDVVYPTTFKALTITEVKAKDK